MASTLDVNAPPFYPSMMWYPAVTDDYYADHPHSPGKEGFVIADTYSMPHEVPDEELFDPKFHPMSPEELLELEQVDEINELLAELDVMETHQELHHKLTQKTRELRSNSDVDVEIQNLMSKASKTKKNHNHVMTKNVRVPSKKMQYHMKRNAFSPLQQPRAVN